MSTATRRALLGGLALVPAIAAPAVAAVANPVVASADQDERLDRLIAAQRVADAEGNAADEAYVLACQTGVEADVLAAEEAREAAYGRENVALAAIRDYQPRTLEGVQRKGRITARFLDDQERLNSYGTEWAQALLRDVLAIGQA